MNDTLEIPEHIRKAAIALEIFFKVNGINEWALMGIQSRRSEPEPTEYCETCNTPLSACGKQGVDGIPTMDCQVCKLRDLLNTERAAREQAEKQIAMDTECIERIRTAGETAEARLAEAIELLKLGKPHLEFLIARNHKHEEPRIAWVKTEQFINATTPPPILAELAELKSKLADERTTSDYLVAAIQMTYPYTFAMARYNEGLHKSQSTPAAAIVFRKLESAEKELAALKAELEQEKKWKVEDPPTPDATGKVLLTKEQPSRVNENRTSREQLEKVAAQRKLDGYDDTGKVLLTKDQWEEAQRDTARLDWIERKFALWHQGSVLSKMNDSWFCNSGFHEGAKARSAIDSAMSADTKGTSA